MVVPLSQSDKLVMRCLETPVDTGTFSWLDSVMLFLDNLPVFPRSDIPAAYP
jgi:hypothetical protein